MEICCLCGRELHVGDEAFGAGIHNFCSSHETEYKELNEIIDAEEAKITKVIDSYVDSKKWSYLTQKYGPKEESFKWSNPKVMIPFLEKAREKIFALWFEAGLKTDVLPPTFQVVKDAYFDLLEGMEEVEKLMKELKERNNLCCKDYADEDTHQVTCSKFGK